MNGESPEDRMERLVRDRTPRPLPRRFYRLASASADHAFCLTARR